MKNIRITYRIFLLLSICLLAACNKAEMPQAGQERTGEVVISFVPRQHDSGQAAAGQKGTTRSQLSGAEVDYRNVAAVYLYVFDATNTCVLVKDLGWNGDLSKEYVLGQLSGEGQYTFLAIGVDDRAGSVYQFPNAIGVGTSLADCQAKLDEAQRTFMPNADLYVGVTTTQIQAANYNRVEVELKRKVAGVIVYLQNIPCEPEGVFVKRLEVNLHTDQHTALPLIRNEANPYGSGVLNDSRLLFSYAFEESERTEGSDIFDRLKPRTDDIKVIENTLFFGAFMLPLEASATGTPTLSITLIGDDAVNHTEKVLKTYEVRYKQADGTPTTAYPIKENCLYSIGKKVTGNSTDGDKPMDLSGNIIEIIVQKYDENYKGDVEFPPVSQPAYIRTDFNPEKYIFNCISTTEVIHIDPSYPVHPWTLTIPREVDWIHIVDRNATDGTVKYLHSISGTGKMDVELLINDYVVYRPTVSVTEVTDPDAINTIKNDFRTANLQLHTSTLGLNNTVSIRQYNAITCAGYQDKPFGLSRLDYGCYFDRQTGKAVRPEGCKIQWGFFKTDIQYIFLNGSWESSTYVADGEYNFKDVDRERDGYIGSLIEKTIKEGMETDHNGNNNAAEKIWFVPAYQEQWNIQFTTQKLKDKFPAIDIPELTNLETGWYWTSSGCYGPSGSSRDSYAAPAYGSRADYEVSHKVDRKTTLNVRQARRFITP